jgi:hypothetical protein
MHEAPHHAAVLKNPPACDAWRQRRLESCRIALLFRGLGLRRRPLALGLVNAQRYETKDARLCVHLYLKVVRGAAPKPPLCGELRLRRGPLARVATDV